VHYFSPPPELPSLVENEGIFLATAMLGALAVPYASGGDKKNPLAWPLYSEADDLARLPPAVISRPMSATRCVTRACSLGRSSSLPASVWPL
jgi:hypothetical protein